MRGRATAGDEQPEGNGMSIQSCGIASMLCIAASFACTARAAPSADFSRTDIGAIYSADFQSDSNAQLVVLTNVGPDDLVLGALAAAGSLASAFTFTGTCANGVILLPGAHCTVIATFSAHRGEGIVTLDVTTNAPGSPHRLTFHGVIVHTLSLYAFPQFVAPWLDFGGQPFATTSSARTIQLTNIGSGRPFSISEVVVGGRHPDDFIVTGTCAAGTIVSSGAACSLSVQFMPGAAGPRSAEIHVYEPSVPEPYAIALWGFGGPSPAVDVIEYYNASLDHYFITWVPVEIAILDAGVQIKGWTRTGEQFRTYVTAGADRTPVCRFYIPPAKGNSHFFGRGVAECDATGAHNPSFVLEDSAFMQMFLPGAGLCAAGQVPIFRVFSNRTDANHRYMTDRALRDHMVQLGWLAEGDGPDLVVMCAPA
jgi:hypothetical protein